MRTICLFLLIISTSIQSMELLDDSDSEFFGITSNSSSSDTFIDFNWKYQKELTDTKPKEPTIDFNRYDSHIKFRELVQSMRDTLTTDIIKKIIAFKLAQCKRNTQEAKEIIEEITYDLNNHNSFVITIGNFFDNSEERLNTLVYDGVSIPDETFYKLLKCYVNAGRFPSSLERLIAILPQKVLEKIKDYTSHFSIFTVKRLNQLSGNEQMNTLLLKHGMNDKKLFLLAQNNIALPDQTYLDLIENYDKKEYYPDSLKDLFAILPQRILDQALAQASTNLIPLLLEHGADIDVKVEGYDKKERKAFLELYKPRLSCKRKFQAHLQIQCCAQRNIQRNIVIGMVSVLSAVFIPLIIFMATHEPHHA